MRPKSKRFKIVLAVITFGLVTSYFLSYLYFRKQLEIVHFQAYSVNNIHRVEAVLPDGRLVFLAIAQLAKDSSDFRNIEEKVIKRIENKVTFLNHFYYPARTLEVAYWNIFESEPEPEIDIYGTWALCADNRSTDTFSLSRILCTDTTTIQEWIMYRGGVFEISLIDSLSSFDYSDGLMSGDWIYERDQYLTLVSSDKQTVKYSLEYSGMDLKLIRIKNGT